MHAQKGDKRDKSGFPVFATVIEANCIQKRNGATNNDLSDEDKRKIKELSNDPQVRCNQAFDIIDEFHFERLFHC